MAGIKDVKMSRKYGLNPTIPICFWCGEKRNEVACVGVVKDENGQEIEMPMYSCIDYEPCDKCREGMSRGFTIMEATETPNRATNREMQKGVYPTGNWVVIRPEAAPQIFPNLPEGTTKAFTDPEAWKMIMDMIMGK